MKLVIAILLSILASCINLVTNSRPPIDTSSLKERHYDSEFKNEDLIGKWKLSSQSEWEIDNWQGLVPGWNAWNCPFTTIEFLKDGTVSAAPNFKIQNLDSTYKSTNEVFGKWTVNRDSIGDYYYEGLLPTNVVNMIFEYPKRHFRGEHLYVMKNKGTILWAYIGDPDSRNYAEFRRQ